MSGTLAALKRSLPRVGESVAIKICAAGEGSRAFGAGDVFLLVRVVLSQGVALQPVVPGKRSVAELARQGFFARVDAHVQRQVPFGAEGSTAVGAGEGARAA